MSEPTAPAASGDLPSPSATGDSLWVGCAALIGFCFGYALPGYAKLPNLFYDPVARVWHVAVRMGPIPMGYYGLITYGVAGALFVGGIAWLVRRLFAPRLSERGYGLWAAWTLTALLVIAGYFTWNNWP